MHTSQAVRASRVRYVDTPTLAVGLAAAAMLASTLTFLALRVVTPSDGLTGSRGSVSWTADGLAVAPLPGVSGLLRDGDRVIAIDGRSLSQWPGDSRPLPSAMRYTVLRGGSVVEVDVRLRPFPLLDVLVDSWSTVAWILAMAGVGAYLFVRRPHEPAARALLTMGIAILASTLPWMVGLSPADIAAGGPLPWLYLNAAFFVYLVFWSAGLHFGLVFPRPLLGAESHTRAIALAYTLPLAAMAAWALGTLPGAANGLTWVAGWMVPQLVIVPLLIVAALALLSAQWRRATHEERSRMRWLMAAGGTAFIAVLLGWFLPQAFTGHSLLPWNAVGLPRLAFPVALGLAVSRHHLFGIETLLRRSLVYGGLTIGVVLVYAASVVALGTILPGEGPYAVTLLATGFAALVALPLRDRLQRRVSRLLYGDRDEPYRALTRLGERLEASLEPRTVLPLVAETVAEVLRLPYAAIELRREAGTVVAAAHGIPRGEPERLPLVHRGEEVGWLVLARRAPDEPFTPGDRELLTGLARQAGAAAYAVRLTVELQASRQELVSTREEERRRLRRELHDGVGPALAGSLMKLEAARTTAALDGATVDHLLDELTADVRRTIEEIRRMAYELRPPSLDQLGLVGALDLEAQRLSTSGLTVRVSAPEPLPGLPAAVEVAAFRIGLEALTNVIHHGHASGAWIELRAVDGALVVDARDDGRGMPADARRGVGLTSMRERAEELGGQLVVEAAREGGVRICARIPLAATAGDG